MPLSDRVPRSNGDQDDEYVSNGSLDSEFDMRDSNGQFLYSKEKKVEIAYKLMQFRELKKAQQMQRILTAKVTTRQYRAPEVILRESSYSQKSDIWAVGCILGELLNTRKPKSHNTEPQNIVIKNLLFPG